MRNLRSVVAGLVWLAATLPMAEAGTTIEESRLVSLPGNTPPAAQDPANDRGLVPDSLALDHIIMTLKRPPAREAALENRIARLTDPASPDYHRWLGAEDLGAQYGPSTDDIARVTGWLARRGFAVNTVYPSGMAIDFSGTAAKVRDAFHTAIHFLEVRGRRHIANTNDPAIPKGLAGVIDGIVSLGDFRGHTASHGGPGWSVSNCGLGSNDLIANCYFVTPPDLATIYNFNPLFKAGTTGSGQTVAVAEDSDIYAASDWTRFRSLFGLSGYSAGSLAAIHPAPRHGANNCSDPGTNGDDFEATLDMEYASAAAPDAAIEVASCASTNATWGLTITVENLVNAKAPPPILSVSYIWCEADAGAANDKAYYDAFQQATAEGVSVYVSAGDEGAATCDYGGSYAAYGIAVNGIASTPYDVAVGGTDFGDTYQRRNAQYWSSTNSADYGSAISYVPEIPWNNSCASRLMAKYVTGSFTTFGTGGFCNSSKGGNFITTLAGGGGPSACAGMSTGGACRGYPKPSWQAVFGNPSDRVRDLPDVSLFSAGAVWGHAYIVCLSDPNTDYGAPCSSFPGGWIYGYGTSFASPIVAGVQALVNQATAAKQGNPDPVLYQLASVEFGPAGDAQCNATLGRHVAKSCIFRDVTEGDTDVPCPTGSPDCYLPSGKYGVLSRSSAKYRPAFEAATGWDFATGLGSIDAANLVKAWPR